MRELKVGDLVIFIDKKENNWWERYYGVSLYGKSAKIIEIDKYFNTYTIEFKEWIGGHDGRGKGKKGYCRWVYNSNQIQSLNTLKLKKILTI